MNVAFSKRLITYEKPRERLVAHGVSTLTDVELLALVIRSGGSKTSVLTLSRILLKKFKGLRGLVTAEINQLVATNHIGLAKATSIKAIGELSLRLIAEQDGPLQYIRDAGDVFNLVKKKFYEKKREYLYVTSLDARKRVIATDLVSVGTATETLVHPREIYKIALKRCAVSIILSHNHPSNSCDPSEEDLVITKRVYAAGKVLGVGLLDHLIVSNTSYSSFKAMGLLNYIGEEVNI